MLNSKASVDYWSAYTDKPLKIYIIMNQSKEIRKYIGIVNIFAVFLGGLEDYEMLLQGEVEFHNGG